jgi:hypothetical protein
MNQKKKTSPNKKPNWQRQEKLYSVKLTEKLPEAINKGNMHVEDLGESNEKFPEVPARLLDDNENGLG